MRAAQDQKLLLDAVESPVSPERVEMHSMALSNGEVNVRRWQIGRRVQSPVDDSMALSTFGHGRGEPANAKLQGSLKSWHSGLRHEP